MISLTCLLQGGVLLSLVGKGKGKGKGMWLRRGGGGSRAFAHSLALRSSIAAEERSQTVVIYYVKCVNQIKMKVYWYNAYMTYRIHILTTPPFLLPPPHITSSPPSEVYGSSAVLKTILSCTLRPPPLKPCPCTRVRTKVILGHGRIQGHSDAHTIHVSRHVLRSRILPGGRGAPGGD